ncbi:alcohol dehydrogenase catalytic domain-containing protein [Christensenellaceae bacterium NSJ-44]|uniref:Alcohol dehydrogenase catalytic domain-containing protein n=1 Tax=Luoshenia tenuis TaxID=2763654 RepID=A0A926CZ99_9FIRM|nr:alcohol dehydrogenase catalytic domain-containing protein [Luoshenia tenuis]MBC8528343.1 alcohol dehydrogenase catalytic domain-containing protein [Luoshenia tenuis]
MEKTMRAVVTHGIHDYRLEQVPVLQPGPGELLVQVEACGICAGDLKAFMGGERFWGGSEFAPYVEPPCIPGHEFIGRVAQVGAGYDGPFQVGDRVTSEQIVPCGTCAYCKRGLYWMCEPHNVYGFKHYLNGGFAEYMIFPRQARVFAVPEQMALEDALLIEPFACAMHGVDRARIEKGDVVVISGAGTLGLGMIPYARRFAPAKIIALDLKEERLALARRQGADLALNPAQDDVSAQVMALSQGCGCDVYIEVAGHPQSVLQGLQLIRKKGRFVEFSVFGEKTTCDWSLIGDAKELDLYGSSLSPECFPKTIAGIADGSLPTAGVVTHILQLEDFEEAFRIAAQGGIKVALRP